MKNFIFLFAIFIFEFYTFNLYAMDSKEISVSAGVELEKQADAYTWDFGAVKENTVVKHDFIFKNGTKKVLNIGSLTTSCGCTVSEVKKKTLEPQEETTIEVQLKTKGYSGDVKQYVYVNTDNMEEPVTRLVIKAKVVK